MADSDAEKAGRSEPSGSPSATLENADLKSRTNELQNLKLEAEIRQLLLSRKANWITPMALAALLPILGTFCLFVYNELAKYTSTYEALAKVNDLEKQKLNLLKEKEALLAEKRTINSDVERIVAVKDIHEKAAADLDSQMRSLEAEKRQLDRNVTDLERRKDRLERYQNAVRKITGSGGVISTYPRGDERAHVVYYRFDSVRDYLETRAPPDHHQAKEEQPNELTLGSLADLGLVTFVHLEGDAAAGHHLQGLAKVGSLEDITLISDKISPAELSHLAQLPELHTLRLNNSTEYASDGSVRGDLQKKFTGNEINVLKGCRKLRRVVLDGQLSQDAIKALNGFEQLEEFHFVPDRDEEQAMNDIRLILSTVRLKTIGSLGRSLTVANGRKLRTEFATRILGLPEDIRFFVKGEFPDLGPEVSANDLLGKAWKKWDADVQVTRVSKLEDANVVIDFEDETAPAHVVAHIGPPTGEFVLELNLDGKKRWTQHKFELYTTMGVGFILGGRRNERGLLSGANHYGYNPNTAPTPTEEEQDVLRRIWGKRRTTPN